MSQFDPNGVGIANGNIFGFPVTQEEATIVITPIPWDATASYGKGASDGPQVILDASTQWKHGQQKCSCPLFQLSGKKSMQIFV